MPQTALGSRAPIGPPFDRPRRQQAERPSLTIFRGSASLRPERRSTMRISVAVVALLIPAIVHAETGVSEKEIVVGSCAALSGPAQEAGTRLVEGGRVYFEQVNAAGGVHGRKIRL